MNGFPEMPPTADERALAERGRVLVAAAAADAQAPATLRIAIEHERARAGVRQPARRRGVLLGGLAGAAAVAVAAIVIAVGGGGAGAPSVVAVAGLSLKPAAAPAPAGKPGAPKLLNAEIDGVVFPYWDDSFHWDATGVRREDISGRGTLTVYYESPKGARLGYTIVAGDALDAPPGRDVTRNGATFRVLARDERTIVTWRRAGHTCVISSPASVPESKLIALAAWTGKGAVRF